MDDLSMLRDREFDIVIHPVSTCYVPVLKNVFHQIARVTRPGGIYISQHKQPTSLQSSIEPSPEGGYRIKHRYYRDAPIPSNPQASLVGRRLRESGAVEFLHRWEQLIGGMCRAGFVIEDLIEPMHAQHDAPVGSFADRASYIPPYVRMKARRNGSQTSEASLWLP